LAVETREINTIFLKLKKSPPFSDLDESILRELIETSRIEKYKAGSYIIREGESSQRTLFYILEGQARARAKIGIEESVAITWGEGYFFGVPVMFSDEPYHVSMIASTDMTCLLIGQEAFQKALYGSDRFAVFFTRILAARLNELYLTFSEYNAGERIIEGPILRRKIIDVCSREVITALPTDSISAIARKMSGARVSSVVIKDEDGKPVDIITEKDMVDKVIAVDNPDPGKNAGSIMSDRLVTIRPNDFTHQALLLMIKNDTNHIVVSDENGLIHGIVTIKDLIRTGNSGAYTVARQIESQNTFSGLAEVIREVEQVQRALLAERSYASAICAITNELYDRITRKVIDLAEHEMITKGFGEPPVGYTFFNMGSAGRKEQFTRTDQDNGIIYADSTKEGVSDYFLELGKIIVRGLEECGFKRCSGGVMAENPHWCLPLSLWKERLTEWVNNLDPKNIRDMTIFLDYRFIRGNEKLFTELREFSRMLFMKSKHALLFLAEDDLRHRASLGLFGRFVTEKESTGRKKINLKNTVQVHMVDCLRVFALREGIDETNSFERIHRLRERSVLKAEDAEYLEAAYENLLKLRIKNVVESIKQGREPDSYIDPGYLTKREKTLLRESILIINRLQSLVDQTFHVHRV
jgi:CBS domain-containing protein